MTTKRICKLCGHDKLLDQFALKKDGKDGRSSRCKTCAAVRQAFYRHSPEGMAVTQSYLLSHPEQRDRKLERLDQWRRANPERVKAVKREYNQTFLAKFLRARRHAVTHADQAHSPEDREHWTNKIIEIDEKIKIYRDQTVTAAGRDDPHGCLESGLPQRSGTRATNSRGRSGQSPFQS